MTMNRRNFLKGSAIAGAALIGGNLLGCSGGDNVSSASNPNEINVPPENIPVMGEADVVVIGAGPGGFAAALRAAREGASVIVIEKYDMPGGVHTSGLQGAAGPGVGGIHTELMLRFAKEGQIYTATEKTLPDWAGNPLSHYDASAKPGAAFSRPSFNPDGGGAIMVRMLQDAGVKALYDTRFVDVVMKAGGTVIESVIVQNASDTQAIRGKVFVDGSGTTEVVARAGAPFVRGGGPQPSTVITTETNWPIPGGQLWIMSGIDFAEVVGYQKSQNDPTLSKLISAALAAGDIPSYLFRPRLQGTGVYANSYIGHPTLDMSPTQGPDTFVFWENVPYEWALHMDDSADDMVRAKVEMKKLVNCEAEFLVKYVPGFKNAYIANIGRYLGIRDGRHARGQYVFSMDDALKGTTFPDAVTATMTKSFYWDGKSHTHQVPYRCFLPTTVNNLLLTGASMSFTYETIFMVMRNFPWCTQTGEIAGYAAAQSVKQGIPPNAYKWTTPMF